QGDAGVGLKLEGFQDANLEDVRGPLWLLMGSVGFVLLIACSNVANLLLVRGTARRLEMSVRTAVGAQRSRVVRQLLTQSMLLALLGGVVGLAVAWIALRGLLAIHLSSLPNVETVHINLAVLGFTLAVSVAVGILFGIAPAWANSRIEISNALREAGR